MMVQYKIGYTNREFTGEVDWDSPAQKRTFAAMADAALSEGMVVTTFVNEPPQYLKQKKISLFIETLRKLTGGK